MPFSNRIPVHPQGSQTTRDDAERGLEHEKPEHTGDGRRHRVRPDQQRLVDARTLDVLVGLRRQKQSNRQRQPRHGYGKNHCVHHGAVVVGIFEELAIVFEPDEIRLQAERILKQERLPDRLRGRPIEKDDGHRELRRKQQQREQQSAEDRALFHVARSALSLLHGRRIAGTLAEPEPVAIRVAQLELPHAVLCHA